MRLNIFLEEPYFSFAKKDPFSFNGWGDNGKDTFFIDYPDDPKILDVELFRILVLPAIQLFHKRCQLANFNSTYGTKIGEFQAPTNWSFPILSV